MRNLNPSATTLRSLLLLGLLMAGIAVHAQKKDDSRYLAGAVPEVNGKVVFSKEYSIPGMPQDEIFDRARSWLETRLQGVNFAEGRVVYEDAQQGDLIGMSRERLVFSQSALALDYAVMTCQLTIECKPEQCLFKVEKVRYVYHEGQKNQEKYAAETWITDKYALNKAKTKLVLGLAKWRRKTVDFVDDQCESLADALSTSAADKAKAKAAQAAEEEEKAKRRTGPIVVTQRNEVNMVTPSAPDAEGEPTPTPPPAEAEPPAMAEAPVAPPVPEAQAEPRVDVADGYEEVAPDALSSDLIQMGAGKLVIRAGETDVTANAGGSLGKMSGKAVVFSFLSPDQAYEAVEAAESYTVSFFPAGQERASVILECRKLPSSGVTLEGQPRMYIGEITKAKIYRGE